MRFVDNAADFSEQNNFEWFLRKNVNFVFTSLVLTKCITLLHFIII
jgi:hypothetical protein